VLTQIYGLTTVADAIEVDRFEPDHLGVVVDAKTSPRATPS
jgi:hypothetical protein